MTNYIAKDGTVSDQRSIKYYFWSIFLFIYNFFYSFSPSAAENLRNGGRSSSGIIYKREEKYVYGKTCGCG
ncbi:hypothetical protein RhiirA5_363539 [Rhizophagus irregularis]|uniref:Uncharacterized protein n=1 Tax=Rhizophagus irregularis TaxID=588596 RepID=A0A2I1DXC6_9GLOM|nr:hypothetical protein RhiirA5_363539 [Rhizophagus irregularis]PKC61050.1 hypothetical protein RhiirA1_425278 [Rhizophagus irregularis]PKK64712.1 hypothetical protein RhiirC2_756272 [Rhizophagus irregularis]PKY14533.1 hypothetical protein RhiirB3_400456 [Rhizophagus irregularis]GET51795.1 hypothetical protein RIR_e73199_A0A2I1DXC6_9GLOM [Rhizophagus irregularis DAOM 181602=DAOM 197198]